MVNVCLQFPVYASRNINFHVLCLCRLDQGDSSSLCQMTPPIDQQSLCRGLKKKNQYYIIRVRRLMILMGGFAKGLMLFGGLGMENLGSGIFTCLSCLLSGSSILSLDTNWFSFTEDTLLMENFIVSNKTSFVSFYVCPVSFLIMSNPASVKIWKQVAARLFGKQNKQKKKNLTCSQTQWLCCWVVYHMGTWSP